MPRAIASDTPPRDPARAARTTLLRRHHTLALVAMLAIGCGERRTPAVMPNLTTVPDDRLDAVIESSLARPGPENRPATKRDQRAETIAATAAAYLGMIFSKDENTTLGVQWMIDDAPARAPRAPDEASPPKPAEPPADTTNLVPWVRLK